MMTLEELYESVMAELIAEVGEENAKHCSVHISRSLRRYFASDTAPYEEFAISIQPAGGDFENIIGFTNATAEQALASFRQKLIPHVQAHCGVWANEQYDPVALGC